MVELFYGRYLVPIQGRRHLLYSFIENRQLNSYSESSSKLFAVNLLNKLIVVNFFAFSGILILHTSM